MLGRKLARNKGLVNRNSILEKLFLLGFALILSLVLSEVILRVFWTDRKGVDISGIIKSDKLTTYSFIEGSHTTITGKLKDFRTEVNINSFGLRGHDPELTMLPGEQRILLFGDSEVFGTGVEENETMACYTESFLNKKSRKDIQYKIINMGMPGTGTLDQEQLFYRYVIKFKPHAVIFLITVANDLEDNIKYITSREVNTEGKRVEKMTPFLSLSNLYVFIFAKEAARSAFVKFPVLRKILRLSRYDFGATSATATQWYDDGVLDKGFDNMKKSFLRIADACKVRDIDMYIAAIPSRTQFDRAYMEISLAISSEVIRKRFRDNPRKPQELIRNFCQDNSVNYIELLNRFKYLSDEKDVLLRYPHDGHLNVEGTKEIAKILAEHVKKDSGFQISK